MLQHFLDFRFEVVTLRHQHELAEVKKRLHILEGFEIVYDALDEMIRIIRKSDGKQDAAGKLMHRFSTRCRAGGRHPRDEALQVGASGDSGHPEGAEGEARRSGPLWPAVLKDAKKRWAVVQDELDEIQKAYADKRRTRIGGAGEEVEYTEEAFIADEDSHVVLSRDGWIKRVREVKDPDLHPAPRRRRGDGRRGRLPESQRRALLQFRHGVCDALQ